jgi:hypothetical protein
MTTRSTDADTEKGEKDPLIAGKEKPNDLDSHSSFLDDAVDTVRLGFPMFISMLAWVGVRNVWYP